MYNAIFSTFFRSAGMRARTSAKMFSLGAGRGLPAHHEPELVNLGAATAGQLHKRMVGFKITKEDMHLAKRQWSGSASASTIVASVRLGS